MKPARRRGRFAPSPTGPLHFGSLIAALASFCDARAQGGEWLLRIEDVDEPRSRAGAEDAILRALVRYGFAWDGPIERQSARTARYERALESLVRNGHAYACTCTRRELETAALTPGGERLYPGTCRSGIAADRASRGQCAWRVHVGDATLSYVDRLQGPQAQTLSREVGDFAVKRSDGLFAYQLAVVADDDEQSITDVVRGADLLSSTPRQIFLQHLLGASTPSYLHIPVALNAAGEKLSKQTRALALPDDPLPALLAAWRFLDQPQPVRSITGVASFWQHALCSWTPARLPPVRMLPAPSRFVA